MAAALGGYLKGNSLKRSRAQRCSASLPWRARSRSEANAYGHVVVRQVIDGQQRLTTFQLFLSAYRDFCKAHDCAALAAECDKFLFNTGMMADEEIDKFKVWPTQLDRPPNSWT